MQAVFIDRFIVPSAANAEFVERMTINRKFIRTLPGFIEDSVYERLDPADDKYRYVTVAVWESTKAINNARTAVFEEYKHQNFEPAEFYKKLSIEAEWGVFKKMLN